MTTFLQILHFAAVIAIGAIYAVWTWLSPGQLDESAWPVNILVLTVGIICGATLFVSAVIYGVSDSAVLKSIFLNNYRTMLTRRSFLVVSNLILLTALVTQTWFVYSFKTLIISYADKKYQVTIADEKSKTVFMSEVMNPGEKVELRIPTGKYSILIQFPERFSDLEPGYVSDYCALTGSLNPFERTIYPLNQ